MVKKKSKIVLYGILFASMITIGIFLLISNPFQQSIISPTYTFSYKAIGFAVTSSTVSYTRIDGSTDYYCQSAGNNIIVTTSIPSNINSYTNSYCASGNYGSSSTLNYQTTDINVKDFSTIEILGQFNLRWNSGGGSNRAGSGSTSVTLSDGSISNGMILSLDAYTAWSNSGQGSNYQISGDKIKFMKQNNIVNWYLYNQNNIVRSGSFDVSNYNPNNQWKLQFAMSSSSQYDSFHSDIIITDILLTKPDADNDGIYDTQDTCPNTQSGYSVNSQGCASNQLDDDTDGVTNDKDICPGTPQNEYNPKPSWYIILPNGCIKTYPTYDDAGFYFPPLIDLPIWQIQSVKEGQYFKYYIRVSNMGDEGYISTRIIDDAGNANSDYVNEQLVGKWQKKIITKEILMPDHPVTINVYVGARPGKDITEPIYTNVFNSYYIPVIRDTDKDGIFDDVDICRDTTIGKDVNDVGCALYQLDSDNDGVNDELDRCPFIIGSTINYGCVVPIPIPPIPREWESILAELNLDEIFA